MTPRFDWTKVAPGAQTALLGVEQYIISCGLEQRLIGLVELRVSQLNGCAYSIDVAWKQLREMGEPEKRLYSLDAWMECPFYSDRERAALLWAEAVTSVQLGRVPDPLYESVRLHFTERELSDLTLAVATINGWNRMSIASRAVPAAYVRPLY